MDKKKIKEIRIIYILLTALLISQNSMSQLVTIDTQLDTNRIMIGDQLNMSIGVTKPVNSVIRFPEFENFLTDEIEIISKSEIDSELIGDDKIFLYQYFTITSFDSGLLYIPNFDFVYISDGFIDTISSSANYLEVIPVKIDTTGTIRDIKGLYRAPYSFGEVYPFIIMLIFVTLLIWFIIYYLKKKKKDEPILKRSKPPEPAHIIAIRALDKLKAEKLWQQNKIKLFYTRLTRIIRTYIERRYSIKAMEETTNEILEEFQGRDIKNINYEILEQLLNLADLVKFAKGQPLPDENITHMENAYLFVMDTKYQPVEEDVVSDKVSIDKQKEISA